jgi:hypothetical protein
MAQNYTTKSGLFLQFGTDKAIPETFGEYVLFGPSRVVEGVINLTSLTTTGLIVSNTTFFPGFATTPVSNSLFIEKIELIPEIASTTGTSATFSLGLIQADRATIPTNYGTAFVSGLANTATSTLDAITTIFGGSTGAGGLIGAGPAVATAPYYITAQTGVGTYTAGQLRVRIYYHTLTGLVTGANIAE